jgi:hypothetical protein
MNMTKAKLVFIILTTIFCNQSFAKTTAFSFATTSTKASQISGAEACAKSYPGFKTCIPIQNVGTNPLSIYYDLTHPFELVIQPGEGVATLLKSAVFPGIPVRITNKSTGKLIASARAENLIGLTCSNLSCSPG